MVTFAIATLFQSEHIDDLWDSLGRRLDAIEQRPARIENLFTGRDRSINA
jgi:hypothetical protein